MVRVLIIDDHEPLLRALGKSLQGAGYEVDTATSGSAALAMFRSAPYDVIVTDLIMPNGEGIETIMVLRKEFSSVGVVAMSGGSTHSPVYLRMARQLGAHVALEKPFTVGELVEAVENVRTLGVC